MVGDQVLPLRRSSVQEAQLCPRILQNLERSRQKELDGHIAAPWSAYVAILAASSSLVRCRHAREPPLPGHRHAACPLGKDLTILHGCGVKPAPRLGSFLVQQVCELLPWMPSRVGA